MLFPYNAQQKNFKDTNLRDVARQKAKIAREAAEQKTEEQPKYRDRASERRIMHNQPEHIPLTAEKEKSTKKRQAAMPSPPSPPPAPVHPSQDESNVGNKLLKMMGWKEGTGLGTEGEGRVEPIQTAIFAQGVGLGASKGKEIGKYADGYLGYVQMAQDATRERYGN
jgi:RNA-binding protein 5/10